MQVVSFNRERRSVLQPMHSAALGHRALHSAASVWPLNISSFPLFSLLFDSHTASNVDVPCTAAASYTAPWAVPNCKSPLGS